MPGRQQDAAEHVIEIERLGELQVADDLIALLWQNARKHPHHCCNAAGLTDLPFRIRALAPHVLGKTNRWLTVLLGCGTEQGVQQDSHAHLESVLLYYPAATEVEIEGVQTPVGKGEVIHMPPGLYHAVRKVSAPRLSVAVVIDPVP